MNIPDLIDRAEAAVLLNDDRADAYVRLVEAAVKWAASR